MDKHNLYSIFYLSNGFLFLPVVLSLVGPTNTAELDEEVSDQEEESDELNQAIEIVRESS